MFLKSVKTKLFPMKTETSSGALTLQRKCFCGWLLWPPPTKLAICCTKSHSSSIHKVKGHGQAVTPSKNGPGMNDEPVLLLGGRGATMSFFHTTRYLLLAGGCVGLNMDSYSAVFPRHLYFRRLPI